MAKDIDTRFLTPEQAAGVRKATETVKTVEAAKTATVTGAGAATTGADFLKALQSRILGDGGIVTSEDTGFEKAVTGIEKAGEAQAARIESQAGREIKFAEEQFGIQRETQLEARRGFATNQAALAQLDVRTEKSLRDMEQRKQELLLAGEESTARQVSQLMVQEMTFRQTAEQQSFSNMLNLGGFAINVMEQERKALEVAGALEAKDVATFTDEAGNVTATNKVTGEVLWTKNIGRTGQTAPNITVSPVSDPITGKFKYTQIRDKDTGEVRFLDAAGNEVSPEEVQIEEGKDSLDILIDSMLEDITSSIIGGSI